jgi:hypothetical protein
VNRKLFEVAFDKNIVAWRIDNKCEKEVTVDVRNFRLQPDSSEYYPVVYPCRTLPVPANTESIIFCQVNNHCRRDEPYFYDVYIGVAPAVDPQVIIKRDKGGVNGFDATKCPKAGKHVTASDYRPTQ